MVLLNSYLLQHQLIILQGILCFLKPRNPNTFYDQQLYHSTLSPIMQRTLCKKLRIGTRRNCSRNAECKTIRILHFHRRNRCLYRDRNIYVSTPNTSYQSPLQSTPLLLLLCRESSIQIQQTASDGTMYL